ncbi:hypothetical protein [Vibrio bivalvicida]|uniref:Uncharacterized protein n=1 Tax=Vibrio bivalvicida TaxID=1276888 RepID=A0ABV4ML52_9VIBR
MKNIQIIDDAINATYDIFSATDEEFSVLFPANTNIAFIEDIDSDNLVVKQTLKNLWGRRVRKCDVQGIHGAIFYGLEDKKDYYPTLIDEEACNPDGSKLRQE